MKNWIGVPLALAAACLMTPHAFAQDDPAPVIQASQAQGVMAALAKAGYEEVQFYPREEEGDVPVISFKHEGLTSNIIFKDCNEAIPDYCLTLVLSTSWDRNTPMSSEAVMKANEGFRYISVWLDEEGDPYAQWAVFTGEEGIPQSVFLDALSRYLVVAQDFWTVVFDGDESDDTQELTRLKSMSEAGAQG